MGSSSHGGERKDQLGRGVTVPMNGLPPEGYPEGSRRVWTPHCINVYDIRSIGGGFVFSGDGASTYTVYFIIYLSGMLSK